MITMQIQALVGYGIEQTVSDLAIRNRKKVIWIAETPELRQQIEMSLAMPTQSPREFLREREYGMTIQANLIIVSDVHNSNFYKKLIAYLNVCRVEVWLLGTINFIDGDSLCK